MIAIHKAMPRVISTFLILFEDREVLEESRQASKSKLSDIMEGTLDFEEFHES